jgi:quinol-cytochrome oxidoreductase complex cytochrome b subunit/coenzyme F420-reducing hydrogenase delta subunit
LFAWVQNALRQAFERLERPFDAAFGPRLNPFHHLGALSFFFFWVVAVSGLYLYIFFETSLQGAYRSIEALTREQWYLGGVMRSLHRYGSDAMVVTGLLHLAREFARDRLRGARWYSWLTGVVLLWFLYASGITGYWLVWDRLAQYVATTTSEWLDVLPLFGEPIARNFLANATVSDRFFSLLVFIHIAVPLFLLLGIWVHIQRISRPRSQPPRRLAAGSLAMLVALSLVHPALSQPPADLDTAVTTLRLDWFYLAAYPLMEAWSYEAIWWIAGLGSLLLMLLPWLPPRREPAAVVNLSDCNGCGRCFADCPYNAVVMRPRTDGLPFEQEAAVDQNLCTACGICVGACPTATPFRQATALVPGIDLPALPASALRERTLTAAARLGSGGARVLVYACRHGAPLDGLEAAAGVAVVELPCSGMLPPSFIDFVITRRHADGVLVAGCAAGDCYNRFGQDWTEQRMAAARDPYLRQRVPRERLVLVWAGTGGRERLERELAAFRERLRALGPYRRVAVPAPPPFKAPAEELTHVARLG